MLPAMDFTLDLLQGAGIAAAVGIRPFLPVLLTGALASADAGLDFDGTDFSFLEDWGFLLAMVVFVSASELAARRLGRDAFDTGPLGAVVAAVAIALGALEAGGSLADRDHPVIAGLLVGAACAALGFLAARSLLARVRQRLDAGTAAALPIYAEGVALLVAGASILFPPLAVLVLGGLGWLLAGSRRREDEKYAGLRILR
jgi:hypothetical protein